MLTLRAFPAGCVPRQQVDTEKHGMAFYLALFAFLLQTVPSGVPLGAQQADHAQVHHAAVAATPNSAHLAPAV